jgi:sarcosine oxidase subunit beta
MRSALVLGGGIMGLSAAWALSRAGVAVRVVEQDELPNPRGASVDDHRLIRHAYGAETGYMRMVDPAFAAWDLLFREAGERPLVETGVLALAAQTGGWIGASRAALRADGHALADLDPATIAARHPFIRPEGIADAFHTPRGGVLLARRIVAMLARLLAARGVPILRAKATGLDPERGRLVLDPGGVAEADLLVIAAGPWATKLLPGLAARVTPTRQVVVRLEPPPDLAAAWADAPMLLDIGATDGFYAVPPVAGTPLKIGDHRFAPAADPDSPREARPDEIAAILDLARPRLSDLDRYRVLSAHPCWYDVEPRERFILEPLGARGFVMSGFSGHGFKFGAVLGLALARAAADPGLAAALPGWAAGQDAPPQGLLADLTEEVA